MIKKLRIKFIVIAMISILIVLSIIMASINISNYVSVSSNADSILLQLYENGGSFNIRGDVPGGENQPQTTTTSNQTISITEMNGEMGGGNFQPKDENPEMMYETRYFSVKIDNATKTYTVKKDFIKAIETEEEAIFYANTALNNSSNKGYIGVYRYYYGVSDGSTLVIFVDCTRGLDNARSFLIASLIISAIGYLCVFGLIVVAAKVVFKPVEEAYQKQKRFISNASHELKTPLAIISANNEVSELIHGSDESTVAINRQVKRLNQMVSSLSLLSKLSEENKLETAAEFDLSEAINDVIADSYILNDESKKVDVTIIPNAKYCGDEGLIRQLIAIVIDNAIKYGETFVTINLYEDNKNLVFECMNDCYEIEDGIHNEVFERFYRSDNIRGAKEGSGIGLSIAKEIADIHKASIVASAVNNTFKIKLTL